MQYPHIDIYIYIYILYIIYIYIYKYYERKKGRNYISRQACFVNRFSEAIHETGLSGNVVTSFFPCIIFILLCFNVLSTVPRENRLADFLYIYIYIYILSILLLSYGTDKENSKSQASLVCSHFLPTSMFDSAAML